MTLDNILTTIISDYNLSLKDLQAKIEEYNNVIKIVLPIPLVESERKLLFDKMAPAIGDKKLEFVYKPVARKVSSGIKGKSNILQVLAVGSGKGGVGKSSVSVNIAAALAADGVKVGLLDADVYGPNVPHFLGIDNPKVQVSEDGKSWLPVQSYGVKTMSVGYLVDWSSPAPWRGPMASKVFEQMFNQTMWGELDLLIIDLPPGTGDMAMSAASKMPVNASLVVTTAQDVALLDSQKAVSFFKQMKIPTLGIVENMSFFQCPSCHHLAISLVMVVGRG